MNSDLEKADEIIWIELIKIIFSRLSPLCTVLSGAQNMAYMICCKLPDQNKMPAQKIWSGNLLLINIPTIPRSRQDCTKLLTSRKNCVFVTQLCFSLNPDLFLPVQRFQAVEAGTSPNFRGKVPLCNQQVNKIFRTLFFSTYRWASNRTISC